MCGCLSIAPLLGTWPTTEACALTGNQTGDSLVHRPALNPLSHTVHATGETVWERAWIHATPPQGHREETDILRFYVLILKCDVLFFLVGVRGRAMSRSFPWIPSYYYSSSFFSHNVQCSSMKCSDWVIVLHIKPQTGLSGAGTVFSSPCTPTFQLCADTQVFM